MRVCKFGGSSLSSAEQIRKVSDIIASDPERRIVVVSAPGCLDETDPKVTDLLIACAEHRLDGESSADELQAVVERFRRIGEDLGLSSSLPQAIARDLEERLSSDASHRARFIDSLKAAGEDNCAKLMAAHLNRCGIDARYQSPREAGLLLSDEFGNAQILPESYDHLASLRESAGVVVFPGFFGHTRTGEVVTFPRGGSDITGAIIAAAVHADVYENFTDVDYVGAVDPDIVPDTRPIPELTYREMRELSYAGFGVLHEEAIIPAVQTGIPICIKNTNCPDAPGTRIVLDRKHKPGEVVGIAGAKGFCTIFVSKYLMDREIGFGRRFLQVFEEEGLSFEHMPSGVDNISIILREKDLDPATESRIVDRIKTDLGADNVTVEHDLALVMIVGEGMRHSVGLAAKVTGAFAAAKVNIEMINQGSSEISMIFGVKAADRDRAVRSLYHAFF